MQEITDTLGDHHAIASRVVKHSEEIHDCKT